MNDTVRRRVRVAMVVAPVLLAVFVAWNARTALLPFLLGVAIAYVMSPAVSWIAALMPFRVSKPHLARGVAIVALYAAIAGVGTGLGFLFVPDAVDEIHQFSDNLPDTIDEVGARFEHWYDRYVPAEQQERTDKWLQDGGDAAGDWAARILPDALGRIGSTFTIILGYLTIPIWLFYTMRDHPRGVRSFVGMFPPEWRHDVRNSLGIVDAVFRNYIRAMLLQGAIIGLMAYVALSILDVKYPIGLAIIAGVTEMIPIIGPIIGAVPAILVALAQDPIKALWVALAFLIIQQIENTLIVPKIQGDMLRIHPGVIIVLLVVAGAVGGLLFVILAVPAAAFIRDLYQYYYLRVGNVPPDEALDRALGEYGAGALRTRWKLEEIIPESHVGNLGFHAEYPLARGETGPPGAIGAAPLTDGDAPAATEPPSPGEPLSGRPDQQAPR